MYNVLTCITTEHDLSHVIAALLVLTFSNCCSLVVFRRSMVAVQLQNQIFWAIAAGTVVGLGIWSTHFIALLGYKPGFEVVFSGGRTILSAMIVVTGFVTTALLMRMNSDVLVRVLCAAIATASVAAMHFCGMTALNASAIMEYDQMMVTTALVLGFMGYVATYLTGANPSIPRSTLLATVFSIIAVLSIHFISATGTTMIPVKGLEIPAIALRSGGLSIIIALAMLLVVFIFAMAAGLDNQFQRIRNKEQRKLFVLADASSEGLFVVAPDGTILSTNSSARTMFKDDGPDARKLEDLGLTPEPEPETEQMLVGKKIQDILQIKDEDITFAGNHDFGERRLRFSDGREMVATVSSRYVSESDGDFIVFAVHDMTQRVRAEARVRTLAYRDSLTGLYNRVAFNMALESAVSKRTGTNPHELAVLIIDLDEFKEVNDQYGHGAGDTLLKSIGRRLSSQLEKKDVLSRLGGDEFAVLLRGRKSQDEITDVASRILTALSDPIAIGRRNLSSGGSIGIAMASRGNHSAARLLTFADRALYSAKEAGRNCFRFYDAELHKQQMEARNLERALHKAVENDELVLHFQPKVNAATRDVVGHEALVRWNRPGIGLVGPDTFIPIAEQSMLIVEIGRWTIQAACRAARHWGENESVAVNLSARQLLDADLVDTVRTALTETGLSPNRFELEITETAIIHNTQLATSILLDLKSLGIKISLDDFGTGYSSMSYIQEFPFDRIKIDRSFVTSMNVDPKSRAIVEAIIHLAHSLQIPVVAEGVETEDQAEALARLACEELQGYLIAAPAPVEIIFEDDTLLFEPAQA
ncbi:MAG TPA: hypothetical protein DCG65_12395 [Hyphomonas atlantica]|uniref:Bifunctional diguanylate cyclase/phosphodiesterase n=1 Tax=Hyphomonas atlantica TaxID=1280948 RepID=A0A356W818_9PROT|nr:hypothetical protein [Hyphomonas atlantica]HBQ49810.1 hypothetical protein [Hyphomonas atlantica]|tara:strand:+ start:2236 stop:4680 length:2445 start_codon:yes stop_codon:yes gene_type:complete